MFKRFVTAFIAFIGIVIPGALGAALLAAPAHPQSLDQSGCTRSLAAAYADMSASQARAKQAGAHGPQACAATRLYFLETVKARAVAAACKSGAERERELGRLDADVQTINTSIAAACG